jgi:hypothetical protein
MKRILLLAAGALGTAGMIAMAAPASADTSATQQSQLEKLGNSEVVNTFLYGNCEGEPVCPDPEEVSHPGVLNQFDFFREDLKNQSAKFENSIDPSGQLKTFVKSITAPPSVPSSDEK